jgi:hypothetical protein
MKTLPFQQRSPALACLLAAAWLAPARLHAQPTAHYVPGVEGIKAASLPPPGIYLRDYNVGYYADRLNDAAGYAIGAANPKAFVYANVPRLIWITDYELLGGCIGVDALVPLQYTSLKATTPAGTFDDHRFAVGDAFAEVTWSKHIPQFDFSLGYGLWAPTGDSSGQPPQVPTTAAGLGYWTHMLTLGATWYLDEGRTLALSALNRYEINQEKAGTEITPGQAYTLEWGASYALSKTVDVGAVGYYQQKVTADSGSGASTQQDHVAAVGPEISVFYPRVMLGWSLRYEYEFLAESRLEGHTLALTITKRF